MKYDTIKHFAALGSVLYVSDRKKVKLRIFIQKWLGHMLVMTSYLVTIATNCRQTKMCLKDKRTATENGIGLQ